MTGKTKLQTPGGSGGLFRLPIILALLLAAGFLPARGESGLTLNFQPTYLTGDFGGSGETDILYFPLGFRYQTQRFVLRATLPYLQVSSTAAGGITDTRDLLAQPQEERLFPFFGQQTEPEVSGLGDVILQGEVFFLQGTGRRPWLSVITRVKLPTAGTALGTGEPDVGGGFGWLQPLGRLSLFASTEYTQVGDPPGIDFQNTLRYDGGVGFAPHRASFLYASYYSRDSIVRGQEDITNVALGWDQRLTPGVKLRTTLYAGLSDTAEDMGFSLGFAF